MIEKDYLPQYAAEAVRDLEIGSKNALKAVNDFTGIERVELVNMSRVYSYIASLLREAVHIVLPPNGEIYRDNQHTGPSEQECPSLTGLPAPITSFEYAWTHELSADERLNNPTYSLRGQQMLLENPRKRITLVVDGKQIADDESYSSLSHTRIAFLSICFHESVKRWNPQPTSVTVFDPFSVFPVNYDDGRKGWGTDAQIFDLMHDEYVKTKEEGAPIFSEFQGDISLVTQACHALRVGAVLENRKDKSYTRTRTFQKQGVGGFEYHVLRLPHGTVKETLGSRAGDERDGPRYHFRRAHLRNLSSGAQTFVRSCFVGNRDKGVVEKTYSINKEDAA